MTSGAAGRGATVIGGASTTEKTRTLPASISGTCAVAAPASLHAMT